MLVFDEFPFLNISTVELSCLMIQLHSSSEEVLVWIESVIPEED